MPTNRGVGVGVGVPPTLGSKGNKKWSSCCSKSSIYGVKIFFLEKYTIIFYLYKNKIKNKKPSSKYGLVMHLIHTTTS